MGPLSRRRLLGITTANAATLLAGCFSGAPDGGGHLYVANNTDERHRIALSVAETSNGSGSIVDGVYRVPERTTLTFEHVLESGSSYEIRARQPDVPEGAIATLDIEVEPCEQGDPSSRRDVRILAGNNGPDIVTYDCDETFEELDGIEYVDPSEHQIGTVTETIPTATPSS